MRACHLQGLVNDVLDLARIEAAQMSLILARVDPDELTQEAVETVRSLVESRGFDADHAYCPGLAVDLAGCHAYPPSADQLAQQCCAFYASRGCLHFCAAGREYAALCHH